MALELPPPAHYAALDMHQAVRRGRVESGERERQRESWGTAAEAGLGAVTWTRRHSSENELGADLN